MNRFFIPRRPVGHLLLAGLLLGGGPFVAAAQAPALTASSPGRNAIAAPRGASVALTFSQRISVATAGNVRVFSGQRGGQLVRNGGGTLSGGGTNTLTLDPVSDFRPNELVQVSVPGTLRSVGGTAVRPTVYQFTAAVGGTGTGTLVPAPTTPAPGVGLEPQGVTAGDVDGDGDLDFLTANATANTVSIRLNDGNGAFTALASVPDVAVGSGPSSVVLGDLDADGDLDLVALVPSTAGGGVLHVQLNDGTSQFRPDTVLGQQPGGSDVTLGDLDGDGDLDILTAALSSGSRNQVSVLRNDGQARFQVSGSVFLSDYALSVRVGDVDADGDLDLLAVSTSLLTPFNVCLNDGTGQFGLPVAMTVLAGEKLELGDVDGDL